MGIPSYFSYILKNHGNIIRNMQHMRFVANVKFGSLYMDCNSIIYDAVRDLEHAQSSLPPTHQSQSGFEDQLITNVISKIKQYIQVIQPTNVVYIAFDGVAPFAKMEQQRTRRYKSAFMACLDFETGQRLPISVASQRQAKWNTTAITPGTTFMETLSSRIAYTFNDPLFATNHHIKTIIVSASNEPGEGEHKMFAYLRENALKHESVAVYGLDSDLIMLSIFHCFYCHNIYIFRESPAFSKHLLPKNTQPNEPVFLNTYKLSLSILKEMGCQTYNKGRIYDYVFLCFLLGNDFLPHFLALNLRTNGIYYLMQMYAEHIGKHPTRGLVDAETMTIQWKWVHTLFSQLAKHEHTWILEEYVSRDKQSNQINVSLTTAKDRENALDNTPMLYRGNEIYICPQEKGWEERYYRVALHETRDTDTTKKICLNYLEGLEWVFKYYTQKCPHWRWKYNYHYPPLLADLCKYIPQHTMDFIQPSKILARNVPFPSNVQLSYVIPKHQHPLLLHSSVCQKLAKYDMYFPSIDNVEFSWIGCRFFWEAHVNLPEVPMGILEMWEKQFGGDRGVAK